MRAVLRSERNTIQGAVVQAMAVGVARPEGNPAREPLGQGCLQAVVVGTHKVRRLVDEVQVGELGGEGLDTRHKIDLIEVPAAAY
jgi:hypothetical protein